VFIGVMTAPQNTQRREAVRRSWMQHPLLSGAQPLFEAKFVVGRVASHPALAKEQAENKDVVSIDCEEGYNQLTNKTLTFMSWFAEHGTAQYVMKLDDDSYPDLDRLQAAITGAGAGPAVYMGLLWRNAPVQRTGKNAERKEDWPADVLPTYAAGPGYLLSKPLARRVGGEHFLLNHGHELHNEDVSMGVWVQREADVAYVDIKASVGCGAEDVVSMQLSPEQMECMAQKQRDCQTPGQCSLCC